MDVRVRPLAGEEWPLWQGSSTASLQESSAGFRGTCEQEAAQPDALWADRLGGTVAHPRGGLWIAEDDVEPLGILLGRLDEAFEVVSIGAMWVAPKVRRRGIGARLLDAALDWARLQGARLAELWVTDGSDEALSLYRRAGFVETGEQQALRSGSSRTVGRLTAELDGASTRYK